MDKVTIYQHTSGTYDWRRQSENGKVVSSSAGQGYENFDEANRMARGLNGEDVEYVYEHLAND